MYNKLFTKILDSSIWLAPDPHRLVWITLLAAMDEDGNAMFACADNVAARARVSVEDAESAIKAFESPDRKSGDPENEGRRIERFPGGWHVLNAHKYRSQVTKAIIREQTRVRVAEYRARNASVTQANAKLTPSEAVSEAPAKAETRAEEEAKTKKTPRKRGAPAAPSSVSSADLIADGLSQELAEGFLQHRSMLKAELTPTAWGLIKKQALQAGVTPAGAAEEMIVRGWRGFKADWLRDMRPAAGQRGKPVQTEAERKAAQQQMIAEAKRMMGFAGAGGSGEVFEGEALERF